MRSAGSHLNTKSTPLQAADTANQITSTESWQPSPYFIRFTIIVALLGSGIGLILLRLLVPTQITRALGPAMLLVLSIAAWYLISRGKTQATLYLLVYGACIAVTGIAIFTGGLQAPIVVAYPLLILVSGWLLGQRAAFFVFALAVLATLFMIIGSSHGTLPASQHTAPTLQGAVQIIIYTISSLLVTLLVRGFQRRISTLQELGRDLAVQTDDLEVGQADLQRAQAVAKVGSWVFDIPKDLIRMSTETCRIFGVPDGTTSTHDTYLSRVYAEDRECVYNAWQQVLNGKNFDHEHRIKVGDGVRWVRQKAEVQFDANGKPIRADGITQDISERKESEDKIYSLAFFDQLTKLPNRTLLLDRLNQVMATSERSGIYSALLFLDLDHFKTLNDTRGHDIGDMLLKQVAKRISHCLREWDTVARFGGDEFVILLCNLNLDRTAAGTATEFVADKILKSLRPSYQLSGAEHHNTASIGATLFKGKAIPMEDLLKQADLSMYKAKAAGRNRCCFFDPVLETAMNERAAMERDLRDALTNNEFELYYQLQVADKGKITGAEVLLRWHQPQHGLVSPADFIPLAEETGLIIPLGKWVLHTACTQLEIWASNPTMESISLSVNVSVQQFNQHDFVEMVLGVVENTGARADRLKLELTENLFVDNVQNIIEKMIALKEAGVGFSLDDFGTGYSSLTYLKQLPFDQLKIDQSFIRDILVDANDAAIAKTIVALAHSFQLGVIAEGVETKAQQDTLAELGCHAYQGYFYGRPIPLAAFEQLISLSYSDLSNR